MKKTKAQQAAEQAAEDEAHRKGWTPHRRGAIYCSPRCGASCTHEAFVTATRRGNALCKRLGPGWEPRVWENMGWFYSAQKGVCEVHANHHHNYPGGVSYSAYFNSAKQFVTSGNTPEAALTAARVAAITDVLKISADLRDVT